MKKLIQRAIDAIRNARRKRRAEDHVTLDHGHHEINIDLRWTPSRVDVSLIGEGHKPVCMGDVDYVGTQVVRDGFILYADIHSTQRTVRWQAQ